VSEANGGSFNPLNYQITYVDGSLVVASGTPIIVPATVSAAVPNTPPSQVACQLVQREAVCAGSGVSPDYAQASGAPVVTMIARAIGPGSDVTIGLNAFPLTPPTEIATMLRASPVMVGAARARELPVNE
jgi:hypothetical protein